MALHFSTGLIQGILNASGIKEQLADGVIRVYTGAQPANADAAVAGTLLIQYTLSSGAWTAGTATNGLEFDAPVAGVLSKAAAETWSGVGVATGTAGWFRFVGNATDAGGSSTTLPRIDGSVGAGSGDLALSNTSITTGAPNTIDTFSITMTQ